MDETFAPGVANREVSESVRTAHRTIKVVVTEAMSVARRTQISFHRTPKQGEIAVGPAGRGNAKLTYVSL